MGRRRLRQALSELPWLVAIAVGAGLLLAAHPTLDHPAGSNWPHYFESAHFFWDPTSAYFGWRTPLYPLLLATLGKPLGYVAAGHLIARMSAVGLVAAAGLLGRAWSGPWAGAIAALCVPLLQCAVESAGWTNMYPVAAATAALAIATGTALTRRPGIAGALIGGVLAGLAWKLNHLGLVTLPMVGGLLLVGLTRPMAQARRGIIAAAFLLGVGGAHSLDTWVLTHWEVPQESLQAQVIQRRREELTRIRDSGDPKFSACTDFEPKPLNLTELSNPCALQFLDNNYGTVQAEDCGPSPTLLLLLLPLAVLPRRWDSGRPEALRDAATSSLIIGGMAGAVYLGAAWTSYSEKYILAFVPILVSLVPVACARLGATAGHLISQPTNGARLGLAGAVVLAATVWPKPTGLHADAPRITPGWEQLSGAAARWAQETLGPDDLLLDCVPLRVDLAMLPHAVPSRFGIGTQMPCSGWIEDPPEAQGTVYMLTRAYPELVHTQPERIAAKGWRRVLRLDQSHSLWQRIASSDRSE